MNKQILAFALIGLFIAGCSSKEDPDVISLKTRGKILNYKDEYQIEAKSKSEITYKSDNEYHASVSESGLVTAGFVGNGNISLTNKSGDIQNVTIFVEPKYTTFPTPFLEFGTSMADIIAKFGAPDVQNSVAIGYEGYSSKAPRISYSFDSDGKLDLVAVWVKTAYSSELGSYMSERYMFAMEEDGAFLFVNGLSAGTSTMAVALTLYDINYWFAIYMPNIVSSDKIAPKVKNIINKMSSLK